MTSRPAILVVEDEVTIRTTMCASLTLMGYVPLQADSVSAALKVLATEQVDAVVLDVGLPDETGLHRSGLSLLRFVRGTHEYAELPVLIFTGRPLSPLEEELVRVNRGRLFYKPQQFPALLHHLNGLLEGQVR
jgi:DNA-binding response OmpR family regulator